MNIWVSKHIDGAKHKDIIIDTLIALKAELGEKLNLYRILLERKNTVFY